MDARDRFRGCLLAGAVGDALGAPVEFWSIAQIQARVGSAGVPGPVAGEFTPTDDTQMTLFTAEGLIRASVAARSKGTRDHAALVYGAYLRWLRTQGTGLDDEGLDPHGAEGWLVTEERLHRRRAPGSTCLSALRSGACGTMQRPLNDSKGCGGVMRAAPVGLAVADPEEAFQLACEIAAITHGHPSGWLPAGVLAAVVALLADGCSLPVALDVSRRMLERRPGHEETSRALEAATRLASTGRPAPEQLEQLGGAWVGEEALAIAVCCALAVPDPVAALLAAVNHSGDSDSTGAICGNLVGTLHGASAVPDAWLRALDVAEIVTQVADDLWQERFDPPRDEHGAVPDRWWARYPGR